MKIPNTVTRSWGLFTGLRSIFYRVILTRFYFGIFSISEKFSWNTRNNFYLGQRKITSTDERVFPMRFRDKSLAQQYFLCRLPCGARLTYVRFRRITNEVHENWYQMEWRHLVVFTCYLFKRIYEARMGEPDTLIKYSLRCNVKWKNIVWKAQKLSLSFLWF